MGTTINDILKMKRKKKYDTEVKVNKALGKPAEKMTKQRKDKPKAKRKTQKELELEESMRVLKEYKRNYLKETY